jgi:hypothetical protein
MWLPSSLYQVHIEATERRNYPYYIIVRYTPPKDTLGILIVAPSDGCLMTAPCLALTQVLQSRHVSSASKSLEAHNAHRSGAPHWSDQPSVVATRASVFSLGFVAQPRNIVVLVNHCKPRELSATSTPVPLMTWPPQSSQLDLGFDAQPSNRTQLCLALLATMWPAFDPVGH